MDNAIDAARDRFARFGDAYNVGDAPLLAGLFTDDATFVNIVAGLARGQAAIEKMHREAFASFLHDTRITFCEVETRVIGPDYIIALGHWSVAANKSSNGDQYPERLGLLSFVLLNADGDWKIAAGQNTQEGSLPRG